MNREVTLREVADADVPLFYEHQADPDGVRMVGGPSRGREAFMAHWKKTSADPTAMRRTILHGGKPAGYVGRFERNGVPEVCYWLGKEHWGQGVATKALALLLESEKKRPLWARVAKRNPASLRVLQKCGFVITAEDKYAGPDGEDIPEFVLKLG